jgi:transcriptional regulator of acetoin/glycerol metabolism
VLEERHLPHDFIDRTDRAAILPKISESPLDAAEGDFLRQTLAAQGGNRIATAHRLGISRSTLWRKLRKHGLHRVR